MPASRKVVCLISAGIDSPVAVWMMIKRKLKVVLVHFHSFPLLSKKSIYKTEELTKILSKYQEEIKLHFVPFQKIQVEIRTKILSKYRIVLYRRFMLRIAEKIAKMEKAKAMVTGESLAQVSSQTLDNLSTIHNAISMPVLRPLLGMDKVEIINLAKKIETYNISIEPHEDCCTLFTPKHPSTKARIYVIEELEKKLNVKGLVKNAIKNRETVKIRNK
jgi:thiamine biosynthesis protein ThiI